jgi:hypothetical protein
LSAITVSQARQTLRLTDAGQDALIQALIDAAEDWVEQRCGVSIGEIRRTDDLDGGGRRLVAPIGPLRAVVSLVDRDDPGATFVEETDYRISGGALVKLSSAQWGAWTGGQEDSAGRWGTGAGRWRLTYDCGYQLPADAPTTTTGAPGETRHIPLPGAMKAAILSLVRRLYDNRGGAESEAAASWSVDWRALDVSDMAEMLAPYRKGGF